MSRIRFKTVKVADWPKFLSVVFVVGTLTVLVWRLVHHVLSTASVPTLTGG